MRTRYEAYGNTAAGTIPNGIGFTGHVNDPDTGLVYMQQRYYDPIAGRFLSVDPVATDANTGKEFGRYTYVDNNPYAKVDPDGRLAHILLGATIGAISGAIGAMNDPKASAGTIFQGALVGAAVGGLTAAVPVGGTMLAAMATNAIAGGAANAAGQLIGTGKVDGGQVVAQAAVGAIGGVVGNLTAMGTGIGLASVASQNVGTTAAVAATAAVNLAMPSSAGGVRPASSSNPAAPKVSNAETGKAAKVSSPPKVEAQ